MPSGLLGKLDEGINNDESVLFYPSLGALPHQDASCRVEVRGRITEERQLVSLTGAALGLAGVVSTDALGAHLQGAPQGSAAQLFRERAMQFLLDGEDGELFDIAIAGMTVKSHASDRQGFLGFLKPWFTVPATDLGTSAAGSADHWVTYSATGKKGRTFEGKSLLLRKQGVIVVSDIDDTIKDTNVPETDELIRNTLFRPFRHTPGMPETYKAWADGGAAFVYLTNSPYQLYGPLQRYLQGEKHYPEGAYYMRSVGKDDLRNTIVKLLAIDGDVAIEENPKKHNLIPILEAFPGRRFILVGDSTELDADIYADLYQGKRFPRGFRAPPNGYADRIAKIYIRDVKSSKKRKEADDAIRRINNPDVARFFDSNRPDILSDGLTVVTSDRGRGTTR